MTVVIIAIKVRQDKLPEVDEHSQKSPENRYSWQIYQMEIIAFNTGNPLLSSIPVEERHSLCENVSQQDLNVTESDHNRSIESWVDNQ